MTDKKSIEQNDLQKALTALQDLAKGHNSREGLSTKVDTMTEVGGSTQLFHTAGDSDPGGWAGTREEAQQWADGIGPDGTDYNGARKMAKSILAKLNKGGQLNDSEKTFVAKGGLKYASWSDSKVERRMAKAQAEDVEAKMMKKASDEEDKEKVAKAADHEDEKEDKKMVRDMIKPGAMKKDVQKSLLDHAAEETRVAPGFEVSEFLAGFADVVHKSLNSMEARITERVIGTIKSAASQQEDYQNSMAKALSGLGEVLTVHAQRIDQVEAAPARGAKSTLTLVKSSGGDDSNDLGTLSKSQISNRLLDLVHKGEVSHMDVLKFDTTGELSQETARKIVSK